MLVKLSIEDVAAVVDEAIAQALEPLQARERALTAEVEALREALRSQPASVDPRDVARLINTEVSRQMAAIPRPKDGVDGAGVTFEEVGTMVARAVAALPPAKDGISVTVAELHPAIDAAVARAVGALPAARDGVGVAGAVIDRAGVLVLTLSDGSLQPLGLVVGKDADMDALAAIIVGEIAKIPRPRDGIDGLGFDDLSVVHDGERAVTIRFVRGDQVKEFLLTIPAIIDRGIWRENKYAKGDGVTWEGSFFIAQCDTEGKPLVSSDWRQAVKAGRPGKNTETVKILPATVKLPGQDPSGDESAS